MLKKIRVSIIFPAIVFMTFGTGFTAEWVNITGDVHYGDTPLCAMVLANGQYMFSCGGDGRYDMDVPLGEDGKITLYSFCEGFAPFKAVLDPWDARYYNISMSLAPADSLSINLSAATVPSSAKPGWYELSGKAMHGTTPLCAMALANGQHMFSCGGDGSYNLEVPLNSEGKITLYGFCEGFAPYKIILEPDNELKVVSPNGGEKWYMGDVHAVEWDTGVSSDDVRIYLFKEKEQTMIRIVSEADNTGSYLWTVPDTLSEGDDYKIYVKSYFDESVSDQSDGYFSIVRRESPDQPPDADAGADKEDVTEGDRVTLNGSGYDSDGWVVSYLWEQTGGPAVEINPSGTVNPMFIAPDVGASEATLTFRFTVTDNDGLTDTDTCSVKVKDRGTFTNSLGMTFNLIYARTFMMGSPEDEPGRGAETLHQVTLTQDFYMQTTEVTQGQWKTVMGDYPPKLYFKNCGDDCPVERVSWDDVQEFITKMSQWGGGTYRLPTEAEWEYAARAGSSTAFANGNLTVADPYSCDYDSNLDAIGWYCGNSDSKTHPVGQKQANAWGLYDMSGNVWEWCQDWDGDYPASAVTDPIGSSTGSYRVRRGGSWNNYAGGCRSAYRSYGSPGYRNYGIGFRLAFSPGQ